MAKYFLTQDSQINSEMQLPAGSFNFVEQGIQESFDSVIYSIFQNITNASSFATSSCYVLYGLVPTLVGTNIYHFNRGAVLWNGEILDVLSATISFTFSTNGLYGNISDYYDPTLDPIQFSDNTYHYCNRYRTMVLSTPIATTTPNIFLGTPQNAFADTSAIYAKSVPNQISALQPTGWSPLTNINSTYFTDGSYTPNYNKDAFGVVRFQGQLLVSATVSNGNTTILTIPSAIIPTIGYLLTVNKYDSVTTLNSPITAAISALGVISIISTTMSPGSYIDISALTYLRL